MRFEKIREEYDAPLAALIRRCLKGARLDIPGTAYYDAELDHLSRYYQQPGREYFLLLEDKKLIGGIGMAEYTDLPDCCELQKLYLEDEYRGQGLGYRMMEHLEHQAAKTGYRRVYLETHTSLQAAIHLYEKCGYKLIGQPAESIHGAMDRFYLKEL